MVGATNRHLKCSRHGGASSLVLYYQRLVVVAVIRKSFVSLQSDVRERSLAVSRAKTEKKTFSGDHVFEMRHVRK